MSVMTIRLPAATHERLRDLARSRGVSLNKVMEDLATRALTEHDVEARFHARAVRGNRAAALTVLNQLDQAEAGSRPSQQRLIAEHADRCAMAPIEPTFAMRPIKNAPNAFRICTHPTRR